MIGTPWLIVVAAGLGAVGLWWLMPWGGGSRPRRLGWLPVALAIGLATAPLWSLGECFSAAVVWTLTIVTFVGAVGTITTRNPVYAAVWFGLTLLGTAALLLCLKAQFLALATIVVYAGAILVMFLFLLMLAQPEGRAIYDRNAWSPHLAAFTGMILVAVLTAALAKSAAAQQSVAKQKEAIAAARQASEASSEGKEDRDADAAPSREIRTAQPGDEHETKRLGIALYGPELLAVEAVGVLLLVALVGAALITSRPTTDDEIAASRQAETLSEEEASALASHDDVPVSQGETDREEDDG
ncbi:MAG: hypothetical protein D6741_03585 [Planctomycetota bacterium]|nr:MAG: hypothetical protein D6741_03585 [Planctomycetota bacterium]